jgi:hypothetical protein
MAISATDPIGPAITRSKRMLFQPFDIGKWFTLGFCSFLASLGEGGGGNFRLPGGGGRRTPPAPAPPVPGIPGTPRMPGGPSTPGGGETPSDSLWQFFQETWQLFQRHAFWVIPALIVLLALGVVLVWVRARGKFMFLDGVVHDRGAVVEPWKRLRELGNSFFRFDLLLTAMSFLVIIILVAIGLLVALPDMRAGRMGGAGIGVIVIGSVLLLLTVVGFAVIKAVAEDFLIPLMYLRGQPISTAWREFRGVLLPGHAGAFVVFYLMRVVLAIAMGIIGLIAMCATCCIGALPYLSNVLLLPLFVFSRLYPLYFLRQFGGEYNLINDPAPVFGFPVIPPPPPPIYGGST